MEVGLLFSPSCFFAVDVIFTPSGVSEDDAANSALSVFVTLVQHLQRVTDVVLHELRAPQLCVLPQPRLVFTINK